MVGGCTPAASATPRVVTAAGPSSRRSRAATSTIFERASARLTEASIIFPTITHCCYHSVSTAIVAVIPLITTEGQIMIIVTGATGALNGATVDHLLERLPASEITVVARDPAQAQHFADRGTG